MKFPFSRALKSSVSSTQASLVWVAITFDAPVAGSTLSRSSVFWSRDWRCTYSVWPSTDQFTRAR